MSNKKSNIISHLLLIAVMGINVLAGMIDLYKKDYHFSILHLSIAGWALCCLIQNRTITTQNNHISLLMEQINALDAVGKMETLHDYAKKNYRFMAAQKANDLQKQVIQGMIGCHFKYDLKLALVWMEEKNPHLGSVSPNEMIEKGRFDKLYKWVETSLDEDCIERPK